MGGREALLRIISAEPGEEVPVTEAVFSSELWQRYRDPCAWVWGPCGQCSGRWPWSLSELVSGAVGVYLVSDKAVLVLRSVSGDHRVRMLRNPHGRPACFP